MSDTQRNDGGQRPGQPEYGAMAGQYPGYDPYLYGRPDDDSQQQADQSAPDAQPAKNQPAHHSSGQLSQGGQSWGSNQPSQQWPAGQPTQPNQPVWQPGGNQTPQPGGAYGQQAPLPFNPYPYGAPEPDPTQSQPASQQPQQYPQSQQYAQPQQQTQQGRPDANMRYGIDLNDPNQNPFYGRWDISAIMAFVFALFQIPLLPALMGAAAMWRTRTFHMKGYGLAVAAVVINILYTLGLLWLTLNGMTPLDLLNAMSTTGTTTDAGTMSA